MSDTASTEGFTRCSMFPLSNIIAKPFVVRSPTPFNVPFYSDFVKISEMLQKFAENHQDSQSPKEKGELEELVKSTQELSMKVSIIMDQNESSSKTHIRKDSLGLSKGLLSKSIH